MSTDPETQATFDLLMDEAGKLGMGMAELVVTGAPPPWDEGWFAQTHRNVIDCAGTAYRQHHPEYPELLVANLQLRVKEGFESRLREMVGNAGFLKGGAS